jgi:hypothetical protein
MSSILRCVTRSALLLALVLAPGGPLEGQSLTEQFSRLFTFGACGEPLCLTVNASVHGNHYVPSVTQGERNTLNFLRGAIGAGLSAVPAAAANAGVQFRLVDGLPVTEDISPGPIFAERAQTLGRGILLVGGNVTGLSFSSLRGQPLSDLLLNFTHENVGAAELGDPSWENDVLEVRTDLDVGLFVTSVYAAYGLTDALDVAVSVPVVRSSLAGVSRIQFNSTDPNSPHRLDPDQETAQAEGSAVGLGDVTVRAKYRVFERDRWAAGVLGEARIPTGREEDFLGTGNLGVRVLGILSGQSGGFAPHVNGGVLLSGSDILGDQLLFVAGFDQILTPSVTLALDLVGAWGLGESALTFPTEVRFDLPARTVRTTNLPDISDDRLDGSVGAKFMAPGGMRILTNVLIPLNKGGMRPGLTWTLGGEIVR